MSSDRTNEDEIVRRFDRLWGTYDGVTTEAKVVELPSEEFRRAAEFSREGYLGGAYVWVVREAADAPSLSETMPADATDERDRVLMILARGSDQWGLPGGGRESGESFEETATREVREETGVECSIVDCFHLRRITTVPEERDGRELHTLQVFFDGAYEGGGIAIQGSELNGAAWFARPPARMLPANVRRAETWFDG